MANGEIRLRILCRNCGSTFMSSMAGPGIELGENNFQTCSFCQHLNRLPVGPLEDLKTIEPPESKARDLKFDRATPYDGISLVGLVTDLCNPNEVVEPVASFVTSIMGLRSMLLVPRDVSWLSHLMTIWALQVKKERYGDRPITEDDNEAFGAEVQQLANKWFEDNPDDKRGLMEDIGRQNVRSMSKGSVMWMGQESLLIAQITGMWTAFETLAGDLWIAAVNSHPKRLSKLSGQRNRIAKLAKRLDTMRASRRVEIADADGVVSRASIGRVTGWTYDLRDKMGSLLKEKFSFRKLNGLRAAYSAAFSEHNDSVDTALANHSLDVLNSVRNVIIHRAGTIDHEYCDQSKGLANAPQGIEGARLALDGDAVTSLVRPALDASIELIRAVDSWITREKAT